MWKNLLNEWTKNADRHGTLTLKITTRELRKKIENGEDERERVRWIPQWMNGGDATKSEDNWRRRNDGWMRDEEGKMYLHFVSNSTFSISSDSTVGSRKIEEQSWIEEIEVRCFYLNAKICIVVVSSCFDSPTCRRMCVCRWSRQKRECNAPVCVRVRSRRFFLRLVLSHFLSPPLLMERPSR
jgi:hypothetical protein